VADDLTNAGGEDRLRINVNEPYELRDWAKTLSVSETALRAAVEAVGDRVSAVKTYLKARYSVR
jgi:hypothetical protein